jgi:hypothetical protein
LFGYLRIIDVEGYNHALVFLFGYLRIIGKCQIIEDAKHARVFFLECPRIIDAQ